MCSTYRKRDSRSPGFTLIELLVVVAIIALLISIGSTARADLPATLGGGNISRNISQAGTQFDALNTVGAGMCRIPVSPNDYGLDTGQPHPEKLDELILLAHRHGIEPILLFEYYTRWHPSLHDHKRWHAIGRAYAQRFQPNSDWLRKKDYS